MRNFCQWRRTGTFVEDLHPVSIASLQSIRPTYKAITFHYIAGTRHTREKTSSDDLTIHANNQSIGRTNVIYGIIIKSTSTLIFYLYGIYKKEILRKTVYEIYIIIHYVCTCQTHSLTQLSVNKSRESCRIRLRLVWSNCRLIVNN